MLGFLNVHYYDTETKRDSRVWDRLVMRVVPAIEIGSESDAMDALPTGDFVTEQELNQNNIDNELYEDVEPAPEAPNEGGPEACALARPHDPTSEEREKHELTRLPFQA
eukprot:12262462-Heterocapsa_arctica.AAC.1